jgi:predicted flavoprotein YhiN
MENFERMGLPLVVERGDRVFPQSMKALDVVSTLERHILQGGLQLRKNSQVSSLAKG